MAATQATAASNRVDRSKMGPFPDNSVSGVSSDDTLDVRNGRRAGAGSEFSTASSEGRRQMGPMPTRQRSSHAGGEHPKTVTRTVFKDFEHRHAHRPKRSHYYYGGYWHDFNIHYRHGPGYGHHYYVGRWSLYPRYYYTRHRRNCFYFFVDLGNYRSRNITTRVYERYVYHDTEPVDVFVAGDPVSRAYAAFGRGSFYQSVIAFNEAIEADPGNGILFLARAQAHIAIKDYRAAYDDLMLGMELVPEWTEVDFNIVELYGDPVWFEEHLNNLDRWVADFPRDYKAHFVLGYIHYFQQNYAAAKSEFIHALAWNEDHEQANRLMDSILEYEAETEVMSAENERLEALDDLEPDDLDELDDLDDLDEDAEL